jgi:hypothetical protein
MSRLKRIVIIFLSLTFAFSIISSAFAQIAVPKRRRVQEEQFKRIEVYFDGGYSFFSMGPAEDAHDVGTAYLLEYMNAMNDTLVMMGVDPGVIYPEGGKDFENVRTMGGGFNFNFNSKFGVGLKIQFANLDAKTSYHQFADDVVIQLPFFGQTQLDQEEVYTCHSKYTYAPIVIRGYYNFNPFAALPGLRCTVGGGPGFYVTTIRNYNSFYRYFSDFPQLLDLNTEFARFTDRYVDVPVGLNIFGGFDIHGSKVMTISFEAEYNFIPEADIKADNWHSGEDFEHTYGLDNDEFIREWYTGVFEDFRPTKMNMSNFRASIALKFAF